MSRDVNIFVSAGETSGDVHTAALIKHLRPLLQEHFQTTSFFGMGGARLREAGAEIVLPMEDLEIMGFLEAAASIVKVRRAVNRLVSAARRRSPDLAVLTDFSGFHFQLGPRLKKLGIPIVYFISPKLWAWWPGRVKKIRHFVDLMITILPFEEDFYRRHDFEKVFYAGNPLVDEISPAMSMSPDKAAGRLGLKPGNIIAVLPGSRPKEIAFHSAPFMQAAALTARRVGEATQIAAALPDASKAALFRSFAGNDVRVFEGEAHLLLRAARIAFVASGTATLEAGLLDTPTVVGFKAGRISMAVARTLVRVPWISLVNLILQQEIFPEHIQELDPELMASDAGLLWEGPRRDTVLKALDELRSKVGPPGALDRASGRIRDLLIAGESREE